jgi:hypothetical protein
MNTRRHFLIRRRSHFFVGAAACGADVAKSLAPGRGRARRPARRIGRRQRHLHQLLGFLEDLPFAAEFPGGVSSFGGVGRGFGRHAAVWGPIFRGLDSSAPLNRLRIVNIVEYLRSIQTK